MDRPVWPPSPNNTKARTPSPTLTLDITLPRTLNHSLTLALALSLPVAKLVIHEYTPQENAVMALQHGLTLPAWKGNVAGHFESALLSLHGVEKVCGTKTSPSVCRPTHSDKQWSCHFPFPTN